MKLTQERTGEILMIFEIVTWATFPILVSASSNFLSPLFFAGASMITSGFLLLLIILFNYKEKFILNKKAFLYMLAGTFFIVIVFFPIIFFSGQKTSAGNLAILVQSEILFTFLFFGLLGMEKINKNRVLGALFTIAGSTFVLLKSFTGSLNTWDFMIVFASMLTPFGNYFQQKAVKIAGSKVHLCFRSLVGGTVILILSLLIEKNNFTNILSAKGIFLILMNGLVAFGISKILFLEAMRRIDVSKILALNAGAPAFTIAFAFIFLKDIPTFEQITGLIFVIFGIYFLTQNDKRIITNQKTKITNIV